MKKKVLFFMHDMNVGGTEKALVNMINLLALDYDIDVLVMVKRGGLLDSLPCQVNIIELNYSGEIKDMQELGPSVYVRKKFKEGNFYRCIKGFLNYVKWKFTGDFCYSYKTVSDLIGKQTKKYDVAVAFAGPSYFISYYILEKVEALKKIQWIHFDVSKISFSKITFRKLFVRYDEINVVSQNGLVKLIEIFPEIKNKTKVFHNVVPTQEIIAKANEKLVFSDDFDGIRIVTVARLTKEKGHDLVVPVIKRLIDKGIYVEWYLIGDGDYRETINKMISDLNVQDSIKVLGTRLNPYPFMKECDIYLQPSYHEGYGITIAEAKLFNKPIVSTNTVGAQEQIVDNQNGLLVDVDTESIYQGLKSLILDKEMRERIASNMMKENMQNKELEDIVL